jgi:ferredoxin
MKSTHKKRPKYRVKIVNKPPYTIDSAKIQRFSTKNIIFNRIEWDSSWKGYRRMYDKEVPNLVSEGREGYTRVDFAFAYAAWTVHDAFQGGFSWKKIKKYRDPAATIGIDLTEPKYEVNDLKDMSVMVKRVARLFGASLVGITKLNRGWMYAEANIPQKFRNAIVFAVKMDEEGIATSPTAPAAAATGVGYSKMTFILAGVGEFIRNLGYEALQCGNDTALSIPLAIDAGLGELGRNGLLITPQYGSRVRLCKIFTDLPMEADSPIEFGVRKFCQLCKLCAENCKVDAISFDDDPKLTAKCQSNNPGTLKWYVDAEQCYLYWCENGVDCSTCIKVCPYNTASVDKPDLSPREFWGIT